ncbi:hypothetical protein PIIN_02071 [Serendipita indica DSM 11827]|uniref:Uncharacterized protein n=1 Tax=Serendipita indica (strain DSM 11827) TaxID=1109443 RepID=G4TA97_SERID|nr:hypothetical protein PIIN_02071 [Serendipita indica DSM 11827]
MFKHTQSHFQSKIANGSAIWNRLRSNMEFVFAIPINWDYTQQQIMCQAAIDAGLFPSHKAEALLHFVTGEEASVHFISAHSSVRHWLRVGSTFGLINTGGSNTSSTLYACTARSPNVVLQQIGASQFVQVGGAGVDSRFQQIIRAKLATSRFGDEETIRDIVDAFEKKTKRLFDGTNTTSVIKFGGIRDMDKAVGIFKGQLTLNKQEILAAFDPVVGDIVGSIRRLMEGHHPQYLLLMGCFGESPYLRARLHQFFGSGNVEIVTAEEPTEKAIA